MTNLYIAGSSVFPTAGANFPTFTIAALTLRLAEHIASELGKPDADFEFSSDASIGVNSHRAKASSDKQFVHAAALPLPGQICAREMTLIRERPSLSGCMESSLLDTLRVQACGLLTSLYLNSESKA